MAAMFAVESSSPLSQSDLAYLESVFAGIGPTWEEMDALIFSDEYLSTLQDGYTSLFFLPEPDTTILVGRDLGIDGRYLHQRFLALRHPLEARALVALHLAPFDARSIAYVLLPYYRLRYPLLGNAVETWAFLKSGSRVMRGVIVHPSTKMKDRWQLTYFDRDGLDCDETQPKSVDVLLDLFSRRYIIPDPDVVDELALHSWKCGQ